MSENKEAIIVTFGNFKDGTGKTTNSTMMAYALSKKGYKVLLCDQDPQANATALYLKTKALESDEIVVFNKTLMAAIQEEDVGQIVTEIKENLYLLPNFSDFAFYSRFLEKNFPEDSVARVQYFSSLIKPLKTDYDFIFIDVPPTSSIITDAALYASGFVVVVLQTYELSLQEVEAFIGYLQLLIDDYDANLDIIGILPVLLKNGVSEELTIRKNARQIFGKENLFKKRVNNMKRLKRFDITGITNKDAYDHEVHRSYAVIADEFIARVQAELAEV